MEDHSITSSLDATAASSIAFTGAVRESLDVLVRITAQARDKPTHQAQHVVELVGHTIEPYRQLVRALEANADYCAPAGTVSATLAHINGTILNEEHISPELRTRLRRNAQTMHACTGNYGVLMREHVEDSKRSLVKLKEQYAKLQHEVFPTSSAYAGFAARAGNSRRNDGSHLGYASAA